MSELMQHVWSYSSDLNVCVIATLLSSFHFGELLFQNKWKMKIDEFKSNEVSDLSMRPH